MRRTPLLFALWFLPLAALVGAGLGCAAYRYQHAAAPAPIRPDVLESTAPSAQFRALSPDAQAACVRGELVAAKEAAAKRGEYSCCIEPSCDHCLLAEGKCTCRDEVELMGPGCGECMQGWLEGRGAVAGVDVWQVLEQRVEEHRHASPPPEPEPPKR